MNDVWNLFMAFVTNPVTNRFAQFFAALLIVVVAWRFVPTILQESRLIAEESVAHRFMRGMLTIAVSIGLGFVVFALVGTLSQGR
jgi:hypothetical protein